MEDIKRIAPNLITLVSWQPSRGQITDDDDDLHHLRALILINFDGPGPQGRYRARSKRDLPPAELPVLFSRTPDCSCLQMSTFVKAVVEPEQTEGPRRD